MAYDQTPYVGKRLSYDGSLCTVRYYGPLASTKGTWIGVEWDDPRRGKHDGSHQGRRIFSCLSKSPTAGSFVRPTRQADSPRTFLEALRFKYGDTGKPSQSQKPVEISGKTVEEVGFEKIRLQQAALQDLRVAVLDELQLCGIGRGPCTPAFSKTAQTEIAQTCPNIMELDLGWSLLEKWQDVADICRPLTKLRILKVSGVRLRSFLIDVYETGESAFGALQELHLNETLLRPPQLAEMLNGHFPQLKILSLAENGLASLQDPDQTTTLSVPALTNLILEKNQFPDLTPLIAMSSSFPILTDLSLQQNSIEKTGKMELAEVSKLALFTNLQTLNLSGNKISEFVFVDQISALFPNLTSMRISRNPLYDVPFDTHNHAHVARADVPYNFTLARIPSLKILNHTTITPRDREEGEIYYLSAAGKEITALLEASIETDGKGSVASKIEWAKAKHPRYEFLCIKHDRESVLDKYGKGLATAEPAQSKPKVAPGALAARLVEARFYLPSPSKRTFQRPIARTIDVYRVKALLSRELKLPPLQFRLIYESDELDPIRDGVEERLSDWTAWGNWDVDGDLESSPDNEPADEKAPAEIWIDGVLLKDGKRWKKREVELLDGTRAWGDYIGNDETSKVNIRVEPYVRF